MPKLVADEFRPTLGEELAPAPRGVKVALAAIVALIVAAVIVAAAHHETKASGTHIVRSSPIAFNLRSTGSLHVAKAQSGELLRLEGAGSPADELVVKPLRLPPYRGNVVGILPIAAAQEIAALRARFPSLELVSEGKARVNAVAGYSIVFRVSRSPRRYGRVIMLPLDQPGARAGVTLELYSSPHAGGGADVASQVGSQGALKTPFRSFRFGTTGP